MKAGFIGTGSMGSMLIEAFVQTGALAPAQIMAANRTKGKAERLADKYPGIRAADSGKSMVPECQIVFICVKPLEFVKVVDEISGSVTPDHIVVSITSPVLIRHLESRLNGKIAKIIPSITNYVYSGVSLCMYGERITAEDKRLLEHLFRHVSVPLEISESFTRISSDISSCGPAFIAYFLRSFIESAVQETGISYEAAEKLACEMLQGTGKLLTEGGMSPLALQQRVSVPGGITEAALKILAARTDDVFCDVIRATHNKYYEDLEKVESMFAPSALRQSGGPAADAETADDCGRDNGR